MNGFGDEEMALEWMQHVDCVNIFPTLPVYLRQCHKRWERNNRIQDAVKKMRSEAEILEELNKKQIPEALAQDDADDDGDNIIMMDDDDDDGDNGGGSAAGDGVNSVVNMLPRLL